MASDILFNAPLIGSPAIVFGAPPDSGVRLVRVAAGMPALGVRVSGHIAAVRVSGCVAAGMPALACAARIGYDNAVLRGPSAEAGAPWADARPLGGQTVVAFESADRVLTGNRVQWSDADPVSFGISAVFHDQGRRYAGHRDGWQDAAPVSSRSSAPWGDMISLRRGARSRWQEAVPIGTRRGTTWGDMLPVRIDCTSRWQDAARMLTEVSAEYRRALPVCVSAGARWQDAIQPRPGRSRVPVTPDPEPFVGNPAILFGDRWTGTTAILFGAPHSDCIEIPILRSYIVLNDVSLRRVSDGKEFEPTALSLSIDYQSWVWGFNASLPGSAFDDLAPAGPDLVELEASVNGVAWRVLVESRKREREFGKRSVSISGRGSAMLLSDTVAPTITLSNAETRTAQQLAAEALAPNGVPLGWTLDWQIDDWMVPAGCWSYQGAPIGAITRIAEAAGAYVQADPATKTLSVLAKYPVAPWAWSSKTPDVILPIDICETESVEETDAAAYSGLYVCGTTAGPLARVYRSGTAGDVLAPQISDALITDATVARMRGIAVLGSAGRKRTITRSLPIMAPAGLIRVGKFLRVDSETDSVLGIVRGASVSCADKAVVRQSLEIECNA